MDWIEAEARAARRGDRRAFARLVSAHADAVRHHVRAIVGEEAADDVIQETFLAAWRGRRSLEEPSRFSGWLLGIARRRACDVLRRRHPGRQVVLPEIADAGPPVDHRLVERQDRAELWAAVDRLAVEQREVLRRYYGDGQSVAEVARELGVPPSTVRKRLSRGREQLRRGTLAGLRVERALLAVMAATGTANTARAAFTRVVALTGAAAVVGLVVAATDTARVAAALPEIPATNPPPPAVVVATTEAAPSVVEPAAPDHLRRAMLAAEDARFHEHGGVDAWAVGRAVWSNVTGDGPTQGGSTITQQLARRVLDLEGAPRGLERKLAETLLAWRIEQRWDKAEILDRYLATVYFGAGAFGVSQAAEAYFHAPVDELTLGQAALLAALPAAPVAHDPRRHPDVARARRDWVLRRMRELSWATDAEIAAAMAEPLLPDAATPVR